jgi:hypothetical protein
VRIVTGQAVSGPLRLAALVLLVGQPMFTLALVALIRRMSRIPILAAFAGWVAVSAFVATTPSPLPRSLTLIFVGYFVTGQFVRRLPDHEARRRTGAAAARIAAAAAGTALFGRGHGDRRHGAVSARVVAADQRVAGCRARAGARLRGGVPAAGMAAPAVVGAYRLHADGPAPHHPAVGPAAADLAELRRHRARRAGRRGGGRPRPRAGARAGRGRGAAPTADPAGLVPLAAAAVPAAASDDDAAGKPAPVVAEPDPRTRSRHRPAAPRPAASPSGRGSARWTKVDGHTYLLITVPLRMHGGGAGTLLVFGLHRTLFTEDDIAVLADLGRQAAVLADRAVLTGSSPAPSTRCAPPTRPRATSSRR